MSSVKRLYNSVIDIKILNCEKHLLSSSFTWKYSKVTVMDVTVCYRLNSKLNRVKFYQTGFGHNI